MLLCRRGRQISSVSNELSPEEAAGLERMQPCGWHKCLRPSNRSARGPPPHRRPRPIRWARPLKRGAKGKPRGRQAPAAAGSRAFAEEIRNRTAKSACHVRGRKGHWAGDPECPGGNCRDDIAADVVDEGDDDCDQDVHEAMVAHLFAAAHSSAKGV